MSNPALEALRMKRSFVEWWQSNIGVDMAETILQGQGPRSEYEISQRSPLIAGQQGDAAALASALGNWLTHASTYWIDADMLTLMGSAAPTMPDQPLRMEDAPREFGFVLFEHSIYLNTDDPREKERIGVRALSWRRGMHYDVEGKTHPGFEVWWYSDRYDKNDMLFRGNAWDKFVSLTGKHEPNTYAGHLHRLIVSHYQFLPFAEAKAMVEDSPFSDRYRRWLTAFWALVQTPIPGKKSIVMQAEVAPDRHLRRQLERQSLPVQHVTFITLRQIKQRKKEEGEETKEVRWTHRWLVDGFWRNQYYPSEDLHRQIYIDPFIKGPEGLPLRIKEKVYRWVR